MLATSKHDSQDQLATLVNHKALPGPKISNHVLFLAAKFILPENFWREILKLQKILDGKFYGRIFFRFER
jgi:hypothetical protein